MRNVNSKNSEWSSFCSLHMISSNCLFTYLMKPLIFVLLQMRKKSWNQQPNEISPSFSSLTYTRMISFSYFSISISFMSANERRAEQSHLYMLIIYDLASHVASKCCVMLAWTADDVFRWESTGQRREKGGQNGLLTSHDPSPRNGRQVGKHLKMFRFSWSINWSVSVHPGKLPQSDAANKLISLPASYELTKHHA